MSATPTTRVVSTTASTPREASGVHATVDTPSIVIKEPAQVSLNLHGHSTYLYAELHFNEVSTLQTSMNVQEALTTVLRDAQTRLDHSGAHVIVDTGFLATEYLAMVS